MTWQVTTSIINKLVFAIVVTLFMAEFAAAKNSFLVAPGRVDFDLGRPTTQSFIITNNGDGRIRLNIEPVYFTIDSESLSAGEHLKPEIPDIENLTEYIKVSPRTLSLAPGQRRDIRISLRPPKELEEGDYRTHLLVKMMETAQVIKTERQGEDSVGMQLNIKLETAVAIYGHKGERKPRLNFTCKVNPPEYKFGFIVDNVSPWRFDGMVSVYAENDKKTPIHQERVVSLRDSRREIKTSWLPDSSGPFYLTWEVPETSTMVGNSTCQVN